MRKLPRIAAAGVAACLAAGAPATAAAPKATGSPLAVLAEPRAGVALFVALIGSARASVSLEIYERSGSSLQRALVAARSRGVKVRGA